MTFGSLPLAHFNAFNRRTGTPAFSGTQSRHPNSLLSGHTQEPASGEENKPGRNDPGPSTKAPTASHWKARCVLLQADIHGSGRIDPRDFYDPELYSNEDLADHVSDNVAHSEQAFEALIRRLEKSGRGILNGRFATLRNNHEDILRETELRLWRYLQNNQLERNGENSCRRLYSRIVSNTAVNDARKTNRLSHSEIPVDESSDLDWHNTRRVDNTNDDTLGVYLRNESKADMRAWLSSLVDSPKLPPEHRLDKDQVETFYLRYIQGLSAKEVAEKTGVPQPTVGSRLRRATKKVGYALLVSDCPPPFMDPGTLQRCRQKANGQTYFVKKSYSDDLKPGPKKQSSER